MSTSRKREEAEAALAPKKQDLLKGKLVHGAPTMDTETSQKKKGKSIDPNFPTPPGWGVMSSKARKKHLKAWHNHIRSGGSSSYVPVRGSSSSGEHPL